MPQQQTYPQYDASGGVQSTTSHLLKKVNEAKNTKNVVFNAVIGAIVRRSGYEQVGRTIQHGKDGLYAGVYRYGRNNKIITGTNLSDDSAAALRYLDVNGYWSNILVDAAANTRFNCLNLLDEFYVAGANDNDEYYPLTLVDSTLTTRRDYNVLGAPAAKFIAEWNGYLFAINCKLNGKYYRDRAYRSSPAIGAITGVQGDYKGIYTQIKVDSVQYLKAGMSVDIYGAGTEGKKVSALSIVTVDKNNKRISFAPTNIDIRDNDEIWLTGRKGKLTRFWNTDYKTPETADFLQISPTEDAQTIPEITAYGKNGGRLFLYTPDSFHKYDGSNFPTVSEDVGCLSPESVKNIGKWTIWFHNSGVWAYNDDTGELRLLSKAIEKFIKAINPVNWEKISAVSIDRVYKLSVGELLPLDTPTTSTSTSSTSTSSTSSSTSSTSTSSTSTSSTSTSTSITTTSTSTTSTSTSTTSTSTSTSSTSTSSSTSSTSTSTVASTKEVYRFCYDFDANIWWLETHKREHRFQFKHRMHGYKKPYFLDETGRLFRDETGNLDHFDTIPMSYEYGRDNFGTHLKKNYESVVVDAERAEACMLLASIDGGPFEKVGQLTKTVNEFTFPFSAEGHDINFKYTHNADGESPIINSITTYWSPQEAQGASG